jgi:YcaO-like protein with predicted kinase domain
MANPNADLKIAEIKWRQSDVSDTLARVEPLLAETGTSEPFDISFTDTLGIPVHIALRQRQLSAEMFRSIKEWGELEFLSIHKGKGVTAAQSRLSCMVEAIERYSGANAPLEGRTEIATRARLGARAITPTDFFLPENVDFSSDKPLTWFADRDLITGKELLAPIDFVLIDFPDSAYPFDGFENMRLGFFLSNGLTAGETIDDALVSGILETAERDLQYRLAKELEPLPVELTIADDAHFGAYYELFKSLGLTLRTYYCDQIDGVYTAIAASFDPYCRTLFQGTATFPDLRIALQQAILELAQQRAWVFFNYRRTRRHLEPIVRYIKEQVHPSSYATSVPADHWTHRCRGPVSLESLGEPYPSDHDSVLDRFSRKHRVVAYDLTHPKLSFPVVRVMTSGLKNGYFNYNPVVSFSS